MSSVVDICRYFLNFFLFFQMTRKGVIHRSRENLLRIVYGNSDIELSDEKDQDAVFEEEAEEDYSESSEDEIEAGQADAEESDQAEQSTSKSSRRPLWSKNTKYTLSLYSKKNNLFSLTIEPHFNFVFLPLLRFLRFKFQLDDTPIIQSNDAMTRQNWTPMDYFKQYIDDSVFEGMAMCTNQHEVLVSGATLNTTSEELKTFFGNSISWAV